jgi:hypothetical protein
MKRSRVAPARAVGLAALLTAGALLVTSCSGAAGPAPTPEPVASLAAAVDCLAPNVLEDFMLPRGPGAQTEPASTPHPDAPEPGRVPAGFVPVAAYLCTMEQPGVVLMEKRTGDFGPLLEALAEPDLPPKADQVCTLEFEIVPELWLEEASGQALRAAWPRDSCGKTQPATQAALDDLTVVSRVVLPVP